MTELAHAHVRLSTATKTHEDQRRVQIFVVLLHELLVVLLGLLAVVFVELSPMVLLSGCRVHRFPAIWVLATFWLGAKEHLLIHPLSAVVSPILVLLPPLSGFLTVIEIRNGESAGRGASKSYPDSRGSCPDPPDPPEFHRFLDLRIEFSVRQTMLVGSDVPSSLWILSVD